MRKLLATFGFLICISHPGSAQKITDLITSDTLVHVYRLNHEQVKFILKSKAIRDTSFLFSQKYREYAAAKFLNDTLPEGNFLIAKVNDKTVHYEYFYKTPLNMSTRVINNDVILFFSDKKSKKPVQDAQVEMDGRPLRYDEGYGGYSFPAKSIDAEKLKQQEIFLKVSYGGEVYIYQYQYTGGSKPQVQQNYYNSKNTLLNSPGYILLDKPLYKPLDSLNLKAFLIDYKTGNPLRRKTSLVISEPQQRFYFSKQIKKKTPGAFLFTWQIPDTLKLDRHFDVELRYQKRGRRLFKKTSFKLEEYELAKNRYELEMPGEMFFAGDDITFYTTASDMNGFPVQGTRVHYRLRIDEILETFTDSMTITAARKSNYYEKDTVIEYENFIETKIPSAVLPQANAKYTLEVTFTNPVSFEKKVITKQFLKYTQKEKLLFYQQQDSLHVHNLYNNRDTARTYYFLTFSGKDTMARRMVTTPFHYKLDPRETAVVILDKDAVMQTLTLHHNKLAITHIKGKRSGDSVMISFAYPFAEPVHYKIYKKDKLVKSGADNRLLFTATDKSMDEYRIVLTTNIQNQIADNFYEIKFVPEKDRLYFEHNIPKTALPGDSVAIELMVRDYKNKPVRKANIAAYAVNAAFASQIKTPYIDVPEEYKNKVTMEAVKSTDMVTLTAGSVKNSYEIRNHHLTRFALRKNEYYLLKYPTNELSEITVKKQQAKPEFAIVITHKDRMYSPKYVLLDGEPVFVSDLQQQKIYSIAAEAGTHTMAFRYFDKLYTLRHVLLKAGTKHIFGINADSIKQYGSQFDIVDSLPMLQASAEEQTLLYNTLLITNVFKADSAEIIADNINHRRKYLQMYGIPQINIDGDLYYVDGPFKSSALIPMKVNGKTYNLKTGYEHFYFYDEILKDFIPKKPGMIKGAFLHFSETELQAGQIIALLHPDTLTPQPEKAVMNFNPKTEKAMQLRVEENLFQSYSSLKSGENFRIIIENKNDSNFIKSIWIVSNSSFESSDFIQNVTKPKFTFIKKNAGERYDIYFFFNDNRMAVWRDQHHAGNDELYINAMYMKTEVFSKEKIEVPLKIYAELNSTPLLPFHDTPFEPKEKIKAVRDKKRSNIYLHGMITNDTQEPLRGAVVYAEINGKFRYGTVTNENGLFEILDMIPATYQLKIMHPEYKFAHFAPILLSPHTEYILNTSLLYKEASAPLYEAVYNDFRLSAFAGIQQRNVLKLNVHEKESRDLLSRVQVKILLQQKLIAAYELNGANIEIPFPAAKEKIYAIEISKPGYTTLRLNGIEFKNNYVYNLHASVGQEKKEILKMKEYFVEMEGMLPTISDKVARVAGIEGSEAYTVEVTDAAVVNGYAAPLIMSEKSVSAKSADRLQSVSYSASQYQKKQDDYISIGGDRTTGTVYLIDGVQVSGGTLGIANITQNEQEYKLRKSGEYIYADADMIDQVITNKNTSAVRKNFSDVGYWKPNMLTNKNGMTAFTLKLPDNITSWKSYIVGVGSKWRHGTDSAETGVYKPLQTTAILPAFLYRNDKLQAKIKYTNLTRDSLDIVTKITVNDHERQSKKVGIRHTYIDSIAIETGSRDSLMFEGGLTFKERYRDFEHYNIPVYSTAMKYHSNQNLLMERDSLYQLDIAPGTKGRIVFNNSLFEKVVAVVNELNQYEYACVEQTSSKLYALLLKDRIQKKLQVKTGNNKDIYNLLAKMSDMQNTGGSFGWWRKNGTNDRMTVYAMEVCHTALKDGFANNVYHAAKDYVTQHFASFSRSDQLYAYHVLLQTGDINSNISNEYKKITTEFLNTTDKIYYYQNKLQLNETVHANDLYAVLLELNRNVARPYYDNFFYDSRADLFKAYSLFKQTPYAAAFINMFRKNLISGQYEKNLNTYSKAQMIDALTTEAMSDSSKPIQASLVINDTLKVNSFPFMMQINGSRYRIKHTGGDVYLNTSEEKRVEEPVKHDSVFGLRTYFVQDRQTTEKIHAGQPCDFTIDLQAFRSGEHVMIEIPVPSGMKVIQKDQLNSNGDYIAYYKHKVVYFFDKLTMGTHQFVIRMMPVFRGNFVLPAAKASLMYYPFVYGNNENRNVTIE